jgi:hypothetical protein
VTLPHDTDTARQMSTLPRQAVDAAEIPGSRSFPGLGYRQQGLRMLLDPIRFFVRLQRRYGDICSWARNDDKFTNVYGPWYNQDHIMPI